MPGGQPLKVVVKGPFSGYSGYGKDGFGVIRALHEWGCEVYPQPTWLDVPIPRDLLPLFGRELRPPFDLLINHWDPGHLSITREARGCARVAVAWTMWEFAGGPGPWPSGKPGPVSGLVPHCRGRSTLPERLRWFDLVLGYDDVSLAALDPYIPRKVHRGVLQGGFDSREWKVAERDWTGDRFGFIMHGALNARKCPWTSIEAFSQLKFEAGSEFAGATLALHTNAPGALFPELNAPFKDQRIRVFVDAFDTETMAEFYASAHCLLAPSRGEGKNLPALEMQATGGVVAGTNFGGHKQWMGADWAYPLDYELTPSFEKYPWAAHDAKVRVAHLKEVIWHIWSHRAEARMKGELASRLIPQMCDWSVVIENLFRRIGDVVTGPGPEICAQAMACRREAEDRRMPALVPGGWRRA
jgi:glycosyltransferase involved in cell wall biosynthesis